MFVTSNQSRGTVIIFNNLSVRKFASRIYWGLQSTRRKILGTKVDEEIWKQRSVAHLQENLVNVSLPHRAWLVDKILANLEITAVLEIGCGCGANLEVIANRAPSLRLVGVDISPASIAVGNQRFTELGLSSITLIEGQADDLRDFPNASIDVVFMDAVLLYIGPDKIQACIEEMRRVAKRSIILLEMHLDGIGFDGTYNRDGWIRDYRVLFKEFGCDVTLVRMPPDLRPAGRWPTYGSYIEVKL